MSPPFITLNIIPDTEIINTFNMDDGTTLPNESYTITGTVEVNLARPIQIRQLYVQFQGEVESVISTADFYRDNTSSDTNYGDEIPINKWNTIDSSGFVDKIARKALGQANAMLNLIDERVMILNESQVLRIGKTCWPFSLKINNVHLLPPSIFLPHHLIQYNLLAKIKLNSLSERVKLTYWNARMNTLRMKNSNNNNENHHNSSGIFNSMSFDSISSAYAPSSLPPLSPTNTITTTATSFISSSGPSTPSITVSQQQITTPPEDEISNNNTDLISSKLLLNNPRYNKRQLLGVNKIIQICRHSYPGIYSLYTIPRIRYRGCRKDRIRYEIGMSKFTCLQKKYFSFICKFESLCEDAKIDSLDYYLEQAELYPIRAGDYNTMSKILPDAMVPRHRKFSRTKHDMQNYEYETELKLTLSLDLPQISPKIQTNLLQISHKLRLILRFKDSDKERNMSLSFPLNVGTVPRLTTTSTPDNLNSIVISEEVERINNDAVHVRQELDQWLLTPDHQENIYCFDKLPSYLDVLQEGNPPSPFLEDIL